MEYYFLTGWSSSQLVDWPLTQIKKSFWTGHSFINAHSIFYPSRKIKKFQFFLNFLIFYQIGFGTMAKRVLNHDEEPNNRVSSKKNSRPQNFRPKKLRNFRSENFFLEIFEKIGHFRNSKSNIRLWLWNSW